MNTRRWYKLHCVGCGKTVLAPQDVARRIADGQSFVMCIPCGDRYEAGSQLVGRRFESPPSTAA